MYQLISNVSRVLFILAVALVTVFVWEKVANVFTFTVLRVSMMNGASWSSRR